MKSHLVTLLILFSSISSVVAQSPLKLWEATAGDFFSSLDLKSTTDGGLILGTTSGPGYHVSKTDENGVVQWSVEYGGNWNESFEKVIKTPDGGYLAGGYSRSGSTGDKTENRRGNDDYWIVKMDGNGVKQWDKTIGGDKLDLLTDMQTTFGGGYILGGHSKSHDSYEVSDKKRGGYDYWMVKIDENGNKIWDRRFGGNYDDYLSSIKQTSDGGYILGGSSASDAKGDKSQESWGEVDYWVVKTNFKGAKQWDVRFGGTGSDYLQDLTETSDGGYLLSGYSNSGISGDKTQSSWGERDYWLVKIDANGVKQWDKRFGGSNDDYLYSTQVYPDGSFLLAGASESGVSGDKTQASQGFYDYWLVKIDATGTKIWDARYGGTDYDFLYNVLIVSPDEIVLAGSSSSSPGGDRTRINEYESSDLWMLKISETATATTYINNFSCPASSPGDQISVPYIANGIFNPGNSFRVQLSDTSGDFNSPTLIGSINSITSDTINATIPASQPYGMGYRIRILSTNPATISVNNGNDIFISDEKAPPKLWDKRFGSSGNDYLRVIHQTSDHGFILGGYTAGGISGDKSQDNWGSSDDYWIVKTDSNGIKQWDKRFGAINIDHLYSLLQTEDGGYLLGGWSEGIGGDKTQPSWGNEDYWIVKTDAVGIKQWDYRFGTTTDDIFQAMVHSPDGGYLLGGYTYSGISGDKTQESKGGDDFWVVKVDGDGIKEWDLCYGGDYSEALSCIQATSDGGYILGGSSSSKVSGDKTQGHWGNGDYWVIKIDENGLKEWDAGFGGNQEETLNCIRQTADGGFLLGGSSLSGPNGDKTTASHGGTDFWIVKIDESGNKVWDASYGGITDEELFNIHVANDGGYILTGHTYSGIGRDVTHFSRGGLDYWIVKIDEQGNKLWDIRYGTSGREYCFDSELLPDGSLVTAGQSFAGMDGDRTQDSRGGVDYWMVKTEPQGFQLEKNQSQLTVNERSSLTLYPNPNSGAFTVLLTTEQNENSKATVEVLNLYGQIIHSENGEIENGRLLKEIKLSDAAEGMFLVKLTINDQVYTSQISLQK